MNRSSKYRSKLNILKTILYYSNNWSFRLCFAPCTILTIETVIILLKISKNVHDLLVYSILKIMVQLHWQYSCSSRYCCHYRNRPLVQVKISGISSGSGNDTTTIGSGVHGSVSSSGSYRSSWALRPHPIDKKGLR